MSLTSLNYVDLRDGRFSGTTRDDLRKLFRAVVEGGTGHIAVHFHGGLVKGASAMDTAGRLLDEYQQATACHPVFVIWHSGLDETIRINAAEVAKKAFFTKLLKRVLAFAAGKVLQGVAKDVGGVTPLGNKRVDGELANVKNGKASWTDMTGDLLAKTSAMSDNDLRQFQGILEGDAAFMDEAVAISNSVRPSRKGDKSIGGSTAASGTSLMSPEVLADIQRERFAAGTGSKGIVGAARLIKGSVVVLANVIARFAAKRDHGFHATVVEEIFREFYVSTVGREIWGLMKQDTADAFKDGSATFGGSAILEELATLNPRPRVTLIGHSAGSEYIVNLLSHADRYLPADFTFDVVLMAPACRTRLFADMLEHFGQRINSFRCFTMDDERERADQLVKALYPHSLLYFISGVLEKRADEPLLGMQRYLTGAAAHYQRPDTGIPAVKAYLLGGSKRLFYSVSSSGPGCNTDATSHGGFDDTAPHPHATIDSVKYILKYGW
ncbi:MAG: hypothetical protein ACYC3L_10935 [Gemmatimonadaceae bacterium]